MDLGLIAKYVIQMVRLNVLIVMVLVMLSAKTAKAKASRL